MDTKDVSSIAPANGTAKDKSPMAKEQFGGGKIEITISLSSDDEKRLRLQHLARERCMWHHRYVLTSVLLLLAVLCIILSGIVMLVYSLGDDYDAGICSNLMFTFMAFGVLFFWIARHAMPCKRKELDDFYSVPRGYWRYTLPS